MPLHLLFSTNRPGVPTSSVIFGIVLVGSMLIPVPAIAQEGVAPAPLTVMRRALEAFDDAPFPTGYVVLEAAFPHTVRKVVPSLDSANAVILATRQGELIIAGPLSHPLQAGIIFGCYHNRYTSEIECPSGPEIESIPSIPLDSVESLELMVHLINGDVQSFVLDPGVDALFLSPSAMAKFAWPYLVRYGVDYAAQRRLEYLDAIQ